MLLLLFFGVSLLCSSSVCPTAYHLVLIAKILPRVCLVEGYDAGGVQLAAVQRALGGCGKAQRDVSHAADHHTRVGRSVVGYAPKPTFQHVVAIEKGHLGGRLQPHLPVRASVRADLASERSLWQPLALPVSQVC